MISGFFVAGALIATVNDAEGLVQYSMFVLLSLMLALVFLCIAVVVATMYRRKSKAFGVALFLWFFYVLFYDLIAVAGSVMFSGQSANRFLFLSLFGNPVDMVRVAGLIILDNVTIFGAAGAALLRFLGGSSVSIIVLTVAMILWVGIPIYISNRMLKKQDI